MPRVRSKPAAVAALFAVILALAAYLLWRRPEPGYRYCLRVIDGDTITLDSNEHVRLIGVDTPEKNDRRPEVRQLAQAAREFTRRLCEDRQVRLQYDWERQDRYGRTLAYVFLSDGTFVNAEIIRQGYGFAYTRFPFRYLDDFRRYEREAREADRGLWSEPYGPASRKRMTGGPHPQ